MNKLNLYLKRHVSSFVLKFPGPIEKISNLLFWVFYKFPILNRSILLWRLNFLQRIQFRIEKAYFLKGYGRVDDPLFHCKIIQKNEAHNIYIIFMYKGLRITGSVKNPANSKTVYLFLDDTCFAKTTIKSDGYFKFLITRSVLECFPVSAVLSFRDKDEKILSECNNITINIPHGNGKIFSEVEQHGFLTKKGDLSISKKNLMVRQNLYLKVYSDINNYFMKQFGKPLFIMYGTLLGYYRDRDFIPGDDDFDCCYLSQETDPVKVREETKKIVIELIKSGYTVSFNRYGRLFRIPLTNWGDKDAYIDICPIWFTGDKAFSNPVMSIPAQEKHFVPLKTGLFRGYKVYFPNTSEVFLSGYYGKEWKVPDPGYVTDNTRLSRDEHKNILKTHISPKDYIQIQDCIMKSGKTEGKFISLSLQTLYPLTDFLD